MRAKNVDFEVTYITKDNKPDWFLEISPHGKVPVLKVDDHALFESNAIAEFLDEVVEPRLHPADPIERARHRAWTDFAPTWSKAFNGFNYAKSKEEMDQAFDELPKTIAKLEGAIAEHRGNDGPYFSGDRICLVDAAYAPFLMRFGLVEERAQSGLLDNFPKVKAWAKALSESDAVIHSVVPDFRDIFIGNLKNRKTYTFGLFENAEAAE